MQSHRPTFGPLGAGAVRPDGGATGVVILCADEAARDAIAYWLTSSAAPTFVAGNGYDASRILQDGRCEWLVTDRILPPWPGLDTFLVLRGRNPGLRIAFVDSGNLHDWSLARVTGATALLQRPLTRKAVVAALAHCKSAP
jgi:DNA-binding NtrC family response regulator